MINFVYIKIEKYVFRSTRQKIKRRIVSSSCRKKTSRAFKCVFICVNVARRSFSFMLLIYFRNVFFYIFFNEFPPKDTQVTGKILPLKFTRYIVIRRGKENFLRYGKRRTGSNVLSGKRNCIHRAFLRRTS